MYKLVIGNRNYSSWSLRAWLFLTESNIEFEEVRIPLFTESWQAQVSQYSPSGRVPVLIDGDVVVWDTTAIMDYLGREHPDAVGWPEPRAMYARARSLSAEMHSGFLAIRDELPQNIRARTPLALDRLSASCREQIARIDDAWSECRGSYGQSGEWLFGEFSIADVMFAPVALRFVTYSIGVSERAQEYVASVLRLPSVARWAEAAALEPETLPFVDDLVPRESTPLTPG